MQKIFQNFVSFFSFETTAPYIILGVIIFLAALFGIILLIQLTEKNEHDTNYDDLELLKSRHMKGEITDEEYEKKKKILKKILKNY